MLSCPVKTGIPSNHIETPLLELTRRFTISTAKHTDPTHPFKIMPFGFENEFRGEVGSYRTKGGGESEYSGALLELRESRNTPLCSGGWGSTRRWRFLARRLGPRRIGEARAAQPPEPTSVVTWSIVGYGYAFLRKCSIFSTDNEIARQSAPKSWTCGFWFCQHFCKGKCRTLLGRQTKLLFVHCSQAKKLKLM